MSEFEERVAIKVEKISDDEFRTIEFDHDPDYGYMSVRDIVYGDMSFVSGFYKNRSFDDFYIHETSMDGIDFGRTQKLSSKLKKIMEQM